MRMNRRNMMKTAVLAAGAAVTAPELLAQRGQGGTPSGNLPESITQLRSMRNQAVPITNDERMVRLKRAQKLMTENKMGALMLNGGTSMDYFLGIRWGLSERMFAFVLPAAEDKQPYFVCPKFEEDRAQELISKSPMAQVNVMTWEEDDSPWRLLRQGLTDRGLASASLGIEETVRYVFSDGMRKESQAIVSGTPVTAGCRMIKSAAELALMKLANTVTLNAYKAAYGGLKEGMSQNDLAGLISTAHNRLGFPGGAMVNVAEYSALPHGSITPQFIREGQIILIDGGCTVEGYQSDISRTFIIGTPTDKMKKVFDIERHAQDAALAAAKPGVAAGSVDAAARKVIEDGGYGPGYKYFTHRVGHGIGMDGHEWPYLVKGNPLKLQTGMCFSDEPGIYIRGEFGVRLEDDMHITENGAELFTPQSESLEKPF